jgi:hypothetical protein
MYNEAGGIADTVRKLRACLDRLPYTAEVLLINDGSEDETTNIALAEIQNDARFRVFSHRVNFGRGRATPYRRRRGARGILVTTERDLSWGTDVVQRMVDFLRASPRYDAVFASPQLAGLRALFASHALLGPATQQYLLAQPVPRA